jgi:hypothetical protein
MKVRGGPERAFCASPRVAVPHDSKQAMSAAQNMP